MSSPVSTEAPPSSSTIAPDAEFDVASLDPANLFGYGSGQMPTPAPTDEPQTIEIPNANADDRTEPDPVKPVEPQGDKPADKSKPDKPEPHNFKQLRQLRDEAEAKLAAAEAERQALAAKLADLEPRATQWESERKAIEARLAEREKAAAEAQAAVWRSNARERPEWRSTAEQIQQAGAEVAKILSTDAIRESGLAVNPVVVLDPGNIKVLNETIKVLNENGNYAEAGILMQKYHDVNKMRGELRAIEARTAEEAKAWHENRELSEANVIRDVVGTLAAANPIYNPVSPEYQALTADQQAALNNAKATAEKAARELRAAADRPEVLLERGYRNTLAISLLQQANAGLQNQYAQAAAELAQAKAQLAAYEKAAGGGGAPGGAGGSAGSNGRGGVHDPTDIDALAQSLDPRNLPGYRGGFGV